MSNTLISGVSTPRDPQWLGIYNGIVVNTNDPMQQGRVQLQVPQVLGNAISNWATSQQAGLAVPAVGTQVFVQFLGGNPNQPYWSEGLTSTVIENITSNANNVINSNPFFVGGSIAGWTGVNGTIAAVQPNPNTSPPYQFGVELTITGSQGGSISEVNTPFIATAGHSYQVSAWVYYPLGGSVNIGAAFNDVGDVPQFDPVTVPAATWTPIETTVVAPATATQGWPIVGPNSSNPGDLFTAEAITVIGQIDGANIVNGSILTGALSFTAQQIGAVAITIDPTGTNQPTSPNIGDLWYDGAMGFLLYQWSGTAWIPYAFGTNAIQAGSITANEIAAQTITGDVIAAGALDGFVINSPTINSGTISATDVLVSGVNGGMFTYGSAGGGGIVLNYPTAGTYHWTCPTGITSVMVECWGGGGTGGSGSSTNGGGGGGGGGEYAAEAALSVTPGNMYTIVVGAHSANSTFNSTSVVAHAGSAGSGVTGGAGGTGSSNTTHHNGGAGGTGGAGVLTVDSNTSAGSNTWTAPAGVTSVQIEVGGAGAGGNGGYQSSPPGFTHGGTGGGGGAYARTTGVSVTPLTGYGYTVGAGGTGGNRPAGGNAGGDSSFNSNQLLAKGGQGGNGKGGDGSQSIGNDTHYGGDGGGDDGTFECGGGGGGGAGGSAARGGAGANNSGTHGGAGGGPGGGGSTFPGAGGKGGDSGSGQDGAGPGGGGGGNGGSNAGGGHGGTGKPGFFAATYNKPAGAGGGGGGSSGSPSGVGNLGATPPTGTGGGTGGAGGQGVTDGGAGGAGGSTNGGGFGGNGPGGGGGGGSGGSFSGANGASGQVRLTYGATGVSTLLVAEAGAVGTDPVLGDAVGPGLNLFSQSSQPAAVANAALLYGNSFGDPAVVLNSGWAGALSNSPAADFTHYTVTDNVSFHQCSNAWSIAANDANVGTTYRLTVAGNGTLGATARQIEFQTSGAFAEVIASVGGNSASFSFKVVVEWTVITTGSGGTANVSLMLSSFDSTNNAGGASTNFAQAVAFNTTTAFTAELQGRWGNTGQTFTSYMSYLERIGP